MKTVIFSLLAAAVSLSSAHAAETFAGLWVDVDLEATLAKLEAGGTQKEFCDNVFYKGDDIDSILRLTEDGKLFICKLNRDQSAPVGKNCAQYGIYSGTKMQLGYPGDLPIAGELTLIDEGHLHGEMHTKSGNVNATQIWELARLSEPRATRLSQGFLGCLKAD